MTSSLIFSGGVLLNCIQNITMLWGFLVTLFLPLWLESFAETILNIYPQTTSLRRGCVGCIHNLLTETVVITVGCWCWLLSRFISCSNINCVFHSLLDGINGQTLCIGFSWLQGFFWCSCSSRLCCL